MGDRVAAAVVYETYWNYQTAEWSQYLQSWTLCYFTCIGCHLL